MANKWKDLKRETGLERTDEERIDRLAQWLMVVDHGRGAPGFTAWAPHPGGFLDTADPREAIDFILNAIDARQVVDES